ncbi:membrane protein [Cryobacterium roopkundense]|uniref:Membrane protein n=1 Tax=Cryobacterium roopkundense TaxID=1001240 RepID=A0A099J087_9MICO|nr:phage holin family protein [Cryobacterium roopkundense]KGJ71631.1 membrane protein [Cryobacterium roopkundense]MBB5641956.1 hypothetical protein [Cryobacterium roopkundense]
MIRFLIRAAIFVGSAALGLWVASLLLQDFVLTWQGFLVTVLIFAGVQSILAPFMTKMTARNAPAFLGGVGLLSTFAALLIASLISNGLVITGWQTWILGTLIVWLVTALATFFLPMIFLREAVKGTKNSRGQASNVRD